MTARRTEESLQSTPIAITAVSGAELAERGATQIAAIADFAPNVNFSFGGTSSGSSAAAVMFIRGVGQTRLPADDRAWSSCYTWTVRTTAAPSAR